MSDRWGPSKQGGLTDESPVLPQTPFGIEQIKARRAQPPRMRDHADDCPAWSGCVCRCDVAVRVAEHCLDA